jgi:pantoate--beta-alanine ligase
VQSKSKATKVIRSVHEWLQIKKDQDHTKSLGVVPTMGALHAGHASLIERSCAENDLTVVTIFVNPTQFNDPSDLEKYPKTFAEDLKLVNDLGVDYLFYPEYADLYPDNYRYSVSENKLAKKLCGEHRPGHFDGVLTIVMKLLNIVDANHAYFGEKDYQQYLLIKDMVESFFMRVKIIPCPIIREDDGLAMSSRNKLLSKEERELAPLFYKELSSSSSLEQVTKDLKGHGFKVDYIEEHFGRRFGAVILGKTRLIDNEKM